MSKIERAFELYENREANKMTVPKIAAKLNISPRTVRGYIYRMRHPDEYKACVQRYFVKRRILAAEAAKQQLPGKPIKRKPAFVQQKPLVPTKALPSASQRVKASAAAAADRSAATVKRLQAKTKQLVKEAAEQRAERAKAQKAAKTKK